jgi:phosphoribosylformylglycinamidine synthase
MEPFEIMVSESQERMLAVVEPEKVDAVLALCEKWQVGGAAIGHVTEGGDVRILRDGEVVGDMPVAALVDGCPLYDLEPEDPGEWIYGNENTLDAAIAALPEETAVGSGAEAVGETAVGGRQAVGETAVGSGREAEQPTESLVLLALLGSPSIASKHWAFEQYDSIVGSRTVRRPESADAAVLQLPEADTAIAVAIDGNGRRVACDPYAGAIEAVLECAQNLACVGAEPLGLTNCLNFGNPEKPTVAWQLDRAVQGLADACNELGIPVVGGNVSLYNETDRGPIYPTPVVGLVGELPDAERAGGLALADGDAIALCGPFAPSLAGSELAKLRGELGAGLPGVDVAAHRDALAFVREAVRSGELSAAHDVSDGGLACALAEMAIAGGIGAKVDLDDLIEARGCAGETAAFGEGPGGFLLSGQWDVLERLVAQSGSVDLFIVGTAGGDAVRISAAETEIDVTLAGAREAWTSLGERVEAITVT